MMVGRLSWGRIYALAHMLSTWPYPPIHVEMELLGLAGAHTADGRDGMRALGRMAEQQKELGLWVSSSATGEGWPGWCGCRLLLSA